MLLITQLGKLGLSLLYPTYQGAFSQFQLIKIEHIVCYTLVENLKAKEIRFLQSADLFVHS